MLDEWPVLLPHHLISTAPVGMIYTGPSDEHLATRAYWFPGVSASFHHRDLLTL